MSLLIIPITLISSRCVSSYPGWWCCRTLPQHCVRHYKTPGATPLSPGTGWILLDGRWLSDPGGLSFRVHLKFDALWRWAGCHPEVPQNHTEKKRQEEFQMCENYNFNTSLIKIGSKKGYSSKTLYFIVLDALYAAPFVISSDSLRATLQSRKARHKQSRSVCKANISV